MSQLEKVNSTSKKESTSSLAQVPADDPRKWNKWKKWRIIWCTAALNCLDTMASSASAPAVPIFIREFNFESKGRTVISLVVSIYVLGVAIGPIVVAPLSERYGRLWFYHVCNLLFILFNVGCALSKNLATLIAFRALTGFASAPPSAIGAGTIADLMDIQERTFATAIWALGAILGPLLGPILGGLICAGVGWRWVFWSLAIAGGVVAIPCALFLRETLRQTPLCEQEPTATSKITNEPSPTQQSLPLGHTRSHCGAAARPLMMLFTDPAIFLFSLYSALAVGYLYILLATFAEVYVSHYGFTTATSGLAYIAIGLGATAGQVMYSVLTDKTVRRHCDSGNDQPEHRLKWMPIGAFTIPFGFIWYGWSVEKHFHWIVSIIGTFPCGVGLAIVLVAPMGYLIDAYNEHAASAIAATVVLRAIVGAFLPLVAFPLYDRLHQGWGNTLLAGIGLVLAPIPLFMFKYGRRLRGTRERRLIDDPSPEKGLSQPTVHE